MAKNFFRVAGLLAMAALVGCEWKGGGKGLFDSSHTRDVWRAQPVKLRVYPSSRLVIQENETVLEARIELLDEMGDSTKGVGHFHFDLYSQGKASGTPAPQRLYAWDVSVLTLAQQKQFYDPVTRTYFFRLKLDSPQGVRRDTVLHVLLSTPENKRISADGPIVAAQ